MWGKATKNRAEVLTWLADAELAAELAAAQPQACATRETLGDQWLDGVEAGTIGRREPGCARAGRPPAACASARNGLQRTTRAGLGHRTFTATRSPPTSITITPTVCRPIPTT
jgi:hypothetical protein